MSNLRRRFSTRALLILGLVLTVVGVFALVAPNVREGSVAYGISPEATAHSEPPSLYERQSEASTSLTLPRLSRGELIGFFKTSASITGFVQVAKRHPELGGFAYAHHAIRLCGAYQSSLKRFQNKQEPWVESESRTGAAATTGLLQQLEMQCSGFDVNWRREAKLTIFNGEKAGDLEAQAIMERPDSSNPKLRDDYLKAVLMAANPIELVFADSLLFVHPPSDFEGTRVYFDGEWRNSNESQAILYAAQLLSCDLGFPCGANRFEVQLECSVSGRCFADFESLVRSWSRQYARDINWEDVQRFRNRIFEAVINRDTKPFIAPTS
jgi:hypothetical protein